MKRIIESKLFSISITSCHDIVPSIIYTKKYYTKLKKLNFIKCSNKTNYLNQILEINYILLNKYFPFYKRHMILGKNILNRFGKYQKIGVHIRMNDKCIYSCNANYDDILLINNISKKMCSKCITILSSFSKKFIQIYFNTCKNVYTYNPKAKIVHSALNVKMSQIDIDKIVIDLYLVSNSDFFLLSGGSTFSLFILYKGYYLNYKLCITKQYFFWNGIDYFDHLRRYRRKDNCTNILSF